MTNEEKQLLLKDLCARLLYEVMIYLHTSSDKGFTIVLNSSIYGFIEDVLNNSPYEIEEIKPYLRPLSSMTEEEKKEFKDTFNGFFQYFNHGIISDSRVWDRNEAVFVGELSCSRLIDWLNAHHFDYRGLIEKGLALEAPEDMYKFE